MLLKWIQTQYFFLIQKNTHKNRSGHGIGYFVTVIFAQVVLSILASVIVMYFSRKREFIADTGGADLAGHQNMINALKDRKSTRLNSSHT